MGDPVEEWVRFCDRMAELGASLSDDRYPQGDREQAEGIRSLMRNMAMTLIQASDYEDPDFPQLYRSYGELAHWGAPNIDNVYLSAAVSPRHVYRLRGNLASCRGVILQVHGRPTDDDPIGVLVDRNSRDLHVEGDGAVEVVLGGLPGAHRNWVPLPDGALRLNIREYLVDWSIDRRPGFTLERLGAEPTYPPPCEAAQVVAALDRSAGWLEHAVPFWNDYVARRHAEIGDNRCSVPAAGLAMGAPDIFYGTGFFALAPGECLLLEFVAPEAPYWAVQLYSTGWYEPLDVEHRQSSLNNHQAHVDDGGVVRMVVSAEDPGTPNWLDTSGRRSGVFHTRAVWCTAPPGPVSTSVVDLRDVPDRLPVPLPRVDAATRADQMAARRTALTRRRTS